MSYISNQLKRFFDWRLEKKIQRLHQQYGQNTAIPVKQLRTAYRFHLDEPGVIIHLFDFSDALFDLGVIQAPDWSTLRLLCAYAAHHPMEPNDERLIWEILSAPEPKVVFLNTSVARGEILNTALSEHREAIDALLAVSRHKEEDKTMYLRGLVGNNRFIA